MKKKNTRKPTAIKVTKKNKKKDNFVAISNKRTYGNALLGIKIYFEGSKPKKLKPDGTIGFGKNILEILKRKFPRFRWIITKDIDSISIERNIYRVRTSTRTLDKMFGEQIDRSKDVKTDIISAYFSKIYPTHFSSGTTTVYVPGTLANTLDPKIISNLSSDDKDAINKFLPDYIASESIGSVTELNAVAQIKTLKEIAEQLELEIDKGRSETWWQNYIKANILIIQQGYIKALDKINTAVGTTKYPDFSLITHDGYLDILEIKKPSTVLQKYDDGRDIYYWDSEISKAIIQTENYIQNVTNYATDIRSFILDKHKINLKVVRPRGIILAGDARKFTEQKQKDDFRLLSQANKNILFLTYDELLTRLTNYIRVLEEFNTKK